MSDVIKTFDGSDDVVQWIEKVEMVARLQKIDDITEFLPLFLTGPALAVYQQLDDLGRDDAGTLTRTLIGAFGLNPFKAYEQLTQKKWKGEPVDAYLAELRRLAKLAGIEGNVIVKRAFIVGLPENISRELRATAKIENLGLDAILYKARAYVSEYSEEHIVAAAKPAVSGYRSESRNSTNVIKCFKCGGPHFLKDCTSRKDRKCWNCGNTGHMARDCNGVNSNSEN